MRVALLARAARVPEAVDVVLHVRRGFVVDDHADVLDVEAALLHVRGHKHLDSALLELPQCVAALALFQVAVQADDRRAGPVERRDKHRGDLLRPREDERRAAVALEDWEDLALQVHHFVTLASHDDDVLCDVSVGHRTVGAAHLDVRGVLREVLRDPCLPSLYEHSFLQLSSSLASEARSSASEDF